MQLGAALVRAGTSVDSVHATLLTVSQRLGLPDANVFVLPTAVLLQVGGEAPTQSRFNSFRRSALRLDQISAIDALSRRSERGEVAARDGLRELTEIITARAPRSLVTRVLGMGVLSLGFALLLQPTPEGVALAFALGLVIGLLRSLDLPRLQAVLPVVATFGVSVVVFEFTAEYGIDNPIRMLIPPLVLFLPGAALTTGTMELATGDTVSGSSRLIEGVVTLLLLAFGIVAAAEVVNLPNSELVDQPIQQLGWLTPVLGLVVMTAGHYLHNCAPRRTIPWILLVSCVAFAGQALGAALVSAQLSGFFGAVVMTPLILWLSGRPDGPPKLTLFLPAFWMLVPGATGLIGVTQAVGVSGVAAGDFAETAITVASITLGVLIGTATWLTTNDVALYARQRLTGRT